MRIEYKLQEWNGGKVWVEEAYPNILFAKDGEIYDIAGMKTIVIGGAYSVDKFYRLSKGYNWFEDEQPSDEIKAYVEKQLSNNDWNVDVVLSHTVPYDYRPVDLFLSMIDQSTVDESTELWLGEIEKKLDYKWWYAGHYHTSRVRGYCDCDVWEMFSFLQTLIPDMLQTLKDTRTGSPGYLGENYTNENGILVNDTCHEEWNCILDKMIFLWREAEKDTCSQKNPFDEAHSKAMDEFTERFGLFGNKLQTEKELEENRKRGGGGTIHFMDELPEYKEISDKYREEEKRLEEYRRKCKDEAIDMLKQYFYDLWD